MVEFFEMAQFMDNKVVSKMLRQANDAVIEIEIAVLRTAAPAGALVPDGNLPYGETVRRAPMRNALVYQCARRFPVLEVIGAIAGRAPSAANSSSVNDAKQFHGHIMYKFTKTA